MCRKQLDEERALNVALKQLLDRYDNPVQRPLVPINQGVEFLLDEAREYLHNPDTKLQKEFSSLVVYSSAKRTPAMERIIKKQVALIMKRIEELKLENQQ
jgi:hypothetical protein